MRVKITGEETAYSKQLRGQPPPRDPLVFTVIAKSTPEIGERDSTNSHEDGIGVQRAEVSK